MRTGALVFHKHSTPPVRESSAVAGGSGDGASAEAKPEMGAQAQDGKPSDPSRIESSKQILSTKQIAVEERVAHARRRVGAVATWCG